MAVIYCRPAGPTTLVTYLMTDSLGRLPQSAARSSGDVAP